MMKYNDDNEKKSRGVEAVNDDDNDDDGVTFYSSPRTSLAVEKPSWESNNDDGCASLPADVVSDDGSSIFYDFDADGGFHKKYVNGTGVLDDDEGMEVTFVRADSAPFKSPSVYNTKRRTYDISDTVDL